MPIDPKQMEAYLEDPSKPKGKGGAKAEPENEEQDSPEEAAAEGDLETRFPKLFQCLEDHGEDFESAADVLDADALASEDGEFEGEEMSLLVGAGRALPEELVAALVEEGADLDWDTAQEIATALEAGEHITDPEKVAGLLFHLSKVVDQLTPEGEEGAEEEEPTDEEPVEEEEMPEGPA